MTHDKSSFIFRPLYVSLAQVCVLLILTINYHFHKIVLAKAKEEGRIMSIYKVLYNPMSNNGVGYGIDGYCCEVGDQ